MTWYKALYGVQGGYSSNSTYLDRCRCNTNRTMPPQPPLGDCCDVYAQNQAMRTEAEINARRARDRRRLAL